MDRTPSFSGWRHPWLRVTRGPRWLRLTNADVLRSFMATIGAAMVAGALASVGLALAGACVGAAAGLLADPPSRHFRSVAVVATWLASVGLAGWIAPIASWSVLAAGVLSLSVEVDVRPGHATFERRLLGVVMTRREIGACAADREVPWLWMTFDGDDFVFPTRCGQPQPTDPVAPIELLFTVADAEAPDADELDRAIRRILREPTRS